MNTLGIMRDIYMSLRQYEDDFYRIHGLTVNEAIVLSRLDGVECSAGELARRCDMGASHCSKVIGALEERGLLSRQLGKDDKRRMYFQLTEAGVVCLKCITCDSVAVPLLLRPLFVGQCSDK